jgi:hypothetical protein
LLADEPLIFSMMKRLLLILILLFPIVTLALWVYFGIFHAGKPLPPPVAQTNSNSVSSH